MNFSRHIDATGGSRGAFRHCGGSHGPEVAMSRAGYCHADPQRWADPIVIRRLMNSKIAVHFSLRRFSQNGLLL
ncbi:unnamed protein product, partial [Iphiclides podalirius]